MRGRGLAGFFAGFALLLLGLAAFVGFAFDMTDS
jgi:hypothetical protein